MALRRLVIPLAFLVLSAACSGPTAPETYPDLSGTWSGNLTIITNVVALGAPSVSTVCIHRWTIQSSTGGQIVGSWESSPDTDLYAVAACQQSGSLTGTISPSGTMSVSFGAVLGVSGCSSAGGGDPFAGSIAVGRISASGQDALSCSGQPTLSRTLSFSLYKQ